MLDERAYRCKTVHERAGVTSVGVLTVGEGVGPVRVCRAAGGRRPHPGPGLGTRWWPIRVSAVVVAAHVWPSESKRFAAGSFRARRQLLPPILAAAGVGAAGVGAMFGAVPSCGPWRATAWWRRPAVLPTCRDRAHHDAARGVGKQRARRCVVQPWVYHRAGLSGPRKPKLPPGALAKVP